MNVGRFINTKKKQTKMSITLSYWIITKMLLEFSGQTLKPFIALK